MNFNIEIPASKNELIELLSEYKNKKYRIGAGCTDLIMELRKKPEDDLTVINISQINDEDFNNIKLSNNKIVIGANTNVVKICTNNEVVTNFPTLKEAAQNLASNQIRQVATIGGNICTASPSGDLICALMALKANLEIIDFAGNKRSVSILEFYKGVRITDLKKSEFLSSIEIDLNKVNPKNMYSGFIKIGTRKSMECSVVSLAYHIQLNENYKVISAGLAFGASAPTVIFAYDACDFLINKNITELKNNEIDEFANHILKYASPIDDLRATAWYRKQVLFNISKSILEEFSKTN
ncbi:MAG: FAD binding domain-containing protein [Bacteroidia bacterium]|nr:FAD binding domain-containing protein [Bacteroidia bacterium]